MRADLVLSAETMLPDRQKRNASGYAGRGPCRAHGTLRIVWRHGHAFRRERAEPSQSDALRVPHRLGRSPSSACALHRLDRAHPSGPHGGAADCPKCVGHSLSRERSAPTRQRVHAPELLRPKAQGCPLHALPMRLNCPPHHRPSTHHSQCQANGHQPVIRSAKQMGTNPSYAVQCRESNHGDVSLCLIGSMHAP